MSKPFFKRARNAALYLAIQLLRGIFLFIPMAAKTAIGPAIGRVAYAFMKKERKIIRKNLDIVFGESMSADEKEEFARNNFRHYGISAFEFIKMTVMKPREIAGLVKEFEGREFLDQAKKEGRGVIGVTAHIGNWEILSIFTAVKGYRTGAVGKKLFDDRIDRLVSGARRREGVMIFDRDTGTKAMLKELKRGIMLGLLVDQDTKVDSVTAPFLGVPAKTPSAPAVLAQRFGFYLISIFITRRTDGYYKVSVEQFSLGNYETIEEIATRYNKKISEVIMQHPEQWVWIHDRWKSVTTDKTQNSGAVMKEDK